MTYIEEEPFQIFLLLLLAKKDSIFSFSASLSLLDKPPLISPLHLPHIDLDHHSSMDTAHWPQEIVVKPIEEIVVTNNSCTAPKPGNIINGSNNLERKTRPPQKEQALNCPRCNSTNTKFCYYNNYSLTQPRYFCKTCRRYWTKGGSLRNIPVGGGSRKNKRSSSSTSSSSKNKLPDLVTHHNHQNPNKIHDHQSQDLNLAFPNSINHETNDKILSSSTATNTATTSTALNHHDNHHQLSALELITGISSRGLNSFMPMNVNVQDPNTVYTSGFPILHDFKQPTTTTLNFSLDYGLGSSVGGYGSSSVLQGVHQDHQHTTNSGRLLFPFEDLKHVSSTASDHIEQNRGEVHGDSTGYWTGMLGGGSW